MNWQEWDAKGYNAATDAALVALGFHDASWGNDVCPSFVHEGLRLRVWIDFVREGEREMGGKRYALVALDLELQHEADVLETDDFADVLAALHRDEPEPVLRKLSHIEALEVFAHTVRTSMAEDDALGTYWTTETEEADKAFWDYIEQNDLQGALGADWEAGALKATAEELITEAMDRFRVELT